MVMFRIIRYIIELLLRINLITGNNGHHFVWVITYLATTEFLLRYKKPHLLFLLQCVHVLKRGLCSSHNALYYSSNSYFKHKLNVLLKPLKEEYVIKTTPHFLRLINPVAYFFTKTAGFEDSINDDSEDEGSNPDEESQHGGNEENMEEMSDFEYGTESDGAIGINIDMTEASSDSTSMLRTPQKRKAEAMEEINVKRSRSTDETENFKHPSSLNLELKTETKDNGKNSTSLPGQSSSSDIKDGTSATSNNRLIEGYDQTTSGKSTDDEIEKYPPKSVKSIFLERFQVSQSRSEDPCGNESKDSMTETFKSSTTPDSPSQNPSPEKRLLEKSVSISPFPQDSELLSTKIFPTDKEDHIPRETKSPTPLHSSISVPLDYHSRSEDTCHTESRETISSDTTTDARRSISQDTDNKLQQILDSKSGVTEENSRKSIKSPKKNLNIFLSRFLNSSTGRENPIRRLDSDIRTTHSPDNISEVCENFPQNIGTVGSHRPSMTPRDLNSSKIISTATKKFFQKSEEKNCEVANNQARDENIAESEKSSTVCADQEESANNTVESNESKEEDPICITNFDRAGCSTDPEYISSFPCECGEGSGGVPSYRAYPGLSLQPLRVKKDARYQKKFYKKKKEIVTPIKLGKIIRWARKVSKDLSHNVPGVPDSDEEKLPLNIYHELAQELVQGFMIAYNNAEEEKSKSLRDKVENNANEKQKNNESTNTGYIQSSFQEESPSSDHSPESPIKANSTAAISRPPSETNLSMVSVSPFKPIEKVSPRVVVQAINWQPPLIDFEKNEPESDQQLHQMNEEKISNKEFNMNVCDIAYEETEIPDAENLWKISAVKSLDQGKESSSSFQMGGIIAKSEEKNQQSEAELLRFERTGIESESQPQPQNVTSRHPCKDVMLRNILEQPISETIEEREFARSFSDHILANLERQEEPSSSDTSSKNNFSEMAVDEQSKISESPEVSPPQEEISETLCFENTSEDEQRAILESLKQPFSEKLNQNYFRQISADNQGEILESSSSDENRTIRSFQELEQIAIMESLGLIKQSDREGRGSNDSEDRANQFFSMEFIEIPPEINIYEDQNLSEEKPITWSSTEHEISDTEEKEKDISSFAEIPSVDENITDSLKPTAEVELRDQNICLPSGLTQSPTIVNVRGNVDKESVHRATPSLLSSEEIKNIGENQPSCSSRRDSSSEKSITEQKNLALNTELESPISPTSPDSADEDNETFTDEKVISRHPCKDAMLRNLLEQPISKTIEEREFARSFSDNILANFESLEEPSSSETSNKNNFPEMAVDEQSKILESPKVSPSEEEISATLCFENRSEDALSEPSDEDKC